ncbi:phenol hydroxylase subunit P4 [Zoogloea sp.]|jgi:phenol hydroxylase P4 protein|uniref:phenol hydroxylase subunit P4 n=1 Tax=Zoogloea sp. TaxID=49181 RepID=UPI002C292B9E|nr:phenol hydroxylase subunit P4 [Zoogloea sp.]HQA11454.1 phenol hydroxylase subunit P4 [Zoogloea sp.]HQE38706.1 phenol hydroxylase subunit P4 [Zoogloea sp.]
MAVAAVKEYQFAPADTVDKFHGAQLLYIGWEDHLLFCAPFAFPFPPTMRFGDIIAGVLPGAFGYHPDFAQIDWSKVEWLKSGKPWQPDADKSLAENGLKHKDVLRFRTPGLTGIKGSFS